MTDKTDIVERLRSKPVVRPEIAAAFERLRASLKELERARAKTDAKP